jgi:ribonuclease/clavin/mitogillin
MPSPDGTPFHDLHDNQILSSLHVIHCPGHTVDSISLYIPEDRALYTADTVLGQGTSVFEDLAKYMSSLQKLLDFPQISGKSYTQLYPGHGPVVSNPREHIQAYIKHRQEREAQILQVLEAKGGTATIWAIVAVIYAAYPESIWLAAAQNTELHLKKLEDQGRVKRVGVVRSGKDSEWQLIR